MPHSWRRHWLLVQVRSLDRPVYYRQGESDGRMTSRTLGERIYALTSNSRNYDIVTVGLITLLPPRLSLQLLAPILLQSIGFSDLVQCKISERLRWTNVRSVSEKVIIFHRSKNRN